MRKFIKGLAGYISRVNQYSNDEEEKIEYALRVLIFEVLKFLGAVIIFSLAGYPVQAFASLITTAVLKPFTGGYHEDTQVKCFAATIIITGCVVYLGTNVILNVFSKIILDGVVLYCIWNQAPVINPKMELTNDSLVKRNRRAGLCLAVLFSILSLLLIKYSLISNTIVWTLVFHALFMFNKRDITIIPNK